MADIIWTKVQVILTEVPIEYMECDSYAFVGNDEVIVEFADQNWENPKIIGFKEEPKTCDLAKIHDIGIHPTSFYNDLYFICAYRPDTDSWEYPKATIRNGSRYLCGAIRNVGAIFIAGGSVYGNNVIGDADIYNMSAETFVAIEDYPDPDRSWWSGFSANSLYYMCGGSSFPESYTVRDNVEKYNSSERTWIGATPLTTGRQALGSFKLGDYGYTMGGMKTQINYDPTPLVEVDGISSGQDVFGSTDMHRYDHAEDVWEAKQQLTNYRWNFCSFEINGLGYISIGSVSQTSGMPGHNVGAPDSSQWLHRWTSDTQQYDSTTDIWKGVSDRLNPGTDRAGAGYGGNGYVGEPFTGFYGSYEKYNPENDTWSKIEDHPSLLGDGTRYKSYYKCAA